MAKDGISTQRQAMSDLMAEPAQKDDRRIVEALSILLDAVENLYCEVTNYIADQKPPGR